MAENQNLSIADVLALIETMNNKNQENMIAFAKEIAKGSPEDQAKREKEAQQAAKRAREGAEIAMAQEKAKEMRKRACPHATTHPGTGVTKHSWRAQVSTPNGEKPYFTPVCQQCWTVGPRIYATSDMLQNGVNLDQYTQINLDVLEKWAKLSEEQILQVA